MSSPPTALGQYQIIREIARSNDIVYEAYDPLMNRRVAIKELAMPQGASAPQQEERINRFKREAQAAGTLNHPNIMTVFSFAEDAGRTFMAMEYLDGCTLRNEIDSKGFLPIDRAIEITINILEGLSHAHSKGVIHRDIKPDNIQILSNGTIKITDFGIARLTFQPNLTMDGQVFGTPSYMSPEQVVGRDIDQRSDLFSVGVVLYEMIAGQKPFSGDSVVAITYAIMNAEAPQPSQASYAIWQVISKALDKSPQLRYANADDMIRALKDAQAQTRSGTMGAVTAPPPANPYANPYLTPQAPAPQPPPMPVYSYNPYQAQPTIAPPPSPYQTSPYQQTPYQQTPYGYQPAPSMAPPTAFPIYYPPPPRSPLMKPETTAFMKRAVSALLLIGTLLILLLVGLNAIVSSFGNSNRDGMDDGKLPSAIAQLPTNMPIAEQIQHVNEELQKPASDGRKATIKRYLSSLYERDGTMAIGVARLDVAEASFNSGLAIDGTNPALWGDKAFVLSQEVKVEQDLDRKVQLLNEAGDDYANAARYEPDSGKRSKFGLAAADEYTQFAQAILDRGDRTQFAAARNSLYSAKDLAGDDAEMNNRIKYLISQLA